MCPFSKNSLEHEFTLANGVRFNHTVSINTTVVEPRKRFGIEQDHLDKFIQEILKVEVEGRRFRTKYQILMKTGSPQAENFLWTILGNKVSFLVIIIIKFIKNDKQEFHFSNYLGNQRSWTAFPPFQTIGTSLAEVRRIGDQRGSVQSYH